jgi:hypothetical protein
MTENTRNWGWAVRWLLLAFGIPVAYVGGMFTASVIGAFIGIPLLLLAWPSSRIRWSYASVPPDHRPSSETSETADASGVSSCGRYWI